MGAQLAVGMQPQVAALRQLTVILYPGGQHAAVAAGEACRLNVNMSAGGQRAAVAELAGGANGGVFAGAQRAAVFNAAVGGQGHAPGLGAKRAGVTHPDAALGADHADFSRVHTAEAGDIHRQLRTGCRVIAGFFDAFVGGIHPVAPGGDLQILGPQPGVNLHRAGDNIGVISGRAVHPGALDGHLAAFDLIAGETAVIELRLAGGQRGAIGIDEAAAVTGNAGWVGDDDLGFFPCHFNHPVQPAGVARVDLVKNDLRFAFRQPGISRHHAAQLALHVFMRVIEDRPLLVNIELAVGIA